MPTNIEINIKTIRCLNSTEDVYFHKVELSSSRAGNTGNVFI